MRKGTVPLVQRAEGGSFLRISQALRVGESYSGIFKQWEPMPFGTESTDEVGKIGLL